MIWLLRGAFTISAIVSALYVVKFAAGDWRVALNVATVAVSAPMAAICWGLPA